MNSENKEEIKFYHSHKSYYEFANFYLGKPINFPSINGYENLQGLWKTAEHLFQASKFASDKDVVEQFRQLETPKKAFQLGRELSKSWSQDRRRKWNGNWKGDGTTSEKIKLMRLIVEYKFKGDIIWKIYFYRLELNKLSRTLKTIMLEKMLTEKI